MNRLILALVVAIAGIAVAATRLISKRGCRHRHGESPGARRRRAFQQAVDDLGAIRDDTDRILAILHDRAAGAGGGSSPG